MASLDLNALLVQLDGFSDELALEEGRRLYTQLFNVKGARGSIHSWRGEEIRFFADRYDHAFKTSSNRARLTFSKAKVALPRIERILWIKEILESRVPNTECRHVPNDSQQWGPPKHLVLAWDYSYVIWLNGLRDGAWRFSSAYPTTTTDMCRYIKISKLVWKI